MATVLRDAVSRELQDNAEKYARHPHILQICKDLSLDDNGMLLLFHPMIGDECSLQILSLENLVEIIRKEGDQTKQERHWSGMLQVLATSTLLKCTIESIYPDVPWNYRTLYHCTVQPLQHDTSLTFPPQAGMHPVIILWTRDGTFDNTPGQPFKANHVVPVVPSCVLSHPKRSAKSLSKSNKRQPTMLNFVLPTSSSQMHMDDTESLSVCESEPCQVHVGDNWDITRFINKALDNETKMNIINSYQNNQPKSTYKYPQSTFGKQKRSFQHQWLSRYKYLMYSKAENGAYCIPCVLFSGGSDRGALCKSAFQDWKDAVEKFEGHFHGKVAAKNKGSSGYAMHLVCSERMQLFISQMEKKASNVAQQLHNKEQENLLRNHAIISSVTKTVIFCGIQGLSLQGHRGTHQNMDDPDVNPGNFLELLKFCVDAGDKILEKHLGTARRNALYTSKTIQNELISIIGSLIQEKIVEDIRKGSGVFAINADEVTDVANKVQLAICIRYVDFNANIKEKFITFVDVTGATSGENLVTAIKNALEERGLMLHNLRGQCYDGAGNMAGKTKGVGPRLLREYPKALHFWCANHKLNLVIVNSCLLLPVKKMMDATDQCVRFFNNSPKREACLQSTIKEESPEGEKICATKLKELCRVRWVERHIAFDKFLDLYEYIVMALETMSNSRDDYNVATVTEASTLLAAVTKFEFITALVVTSRLLSYLKPLSSYLQTRALDLSRAFGAIELVRSSLQEVRADVDAYHEVWFDQAVEKAQKVNVEPSMPRIVRRQTLRANNPAENPQDHYRRNLTIPFLDQVLEEMKNRFTDEHKNALVGMNLIPAKIVAEPQLQVQQFHQYNDDIPSQADLAAELHMWKNHWRRSDLADGETLEGALRVASNMKDTFPNIHAILQLMAVLPVTSSESERVFSQLKLLKTYLRSTMTEERLIGLGLMKVHRGMTNAIDIEQVVARFARSNPRRMALENIFKD